MFEFDMFLYKCFFYSGSHMSVLPAPDSVSLPDATGTNSIAQLSLSFTAVPLPLLLVEAPEVVLTIATMMMLRNHRTIKIKVSLRRH